MPEPTVLLLSTSDTDLITARASGAHYRWANPSRLVDGELEELLAGADVAVVRILGGYRAWQDGIDTVVASGLPTVVVSGEQSPDADLMGHSTTPRRRGTAVPHLSRSRRRREPAATACLSLRHAADDGPRLRAPGDHAELGHPRPGGSRPRRPHNRGALLPRPASCRQHRLRRGAVRRHRGCRRSAAAGFLRLAADSRRRTAGPAQHRRGDGHHRAGRWRRHTRHGHRRRQRRQLERGPSGGAGHPDPAGPVPDQFPSAVAGQRRRPVPARRRHPGRGAGVRRAHHHGSVLVQGD